MESEEQRRLREERERQEQGAAPESQPVDYRSEESTGATDPAQKASRTPNVTPGTDRRRPEETPEEEKPAAERLGLDNPGSAASALIAQTAMEKGATSAGGGVTQGQILTVLRMALADRGANERDGVSAAIRWVLARLPNDLQAEPLESDEERRAREEASLGGTTPENQRTSISNPPADTKEQELERMDIPERDRITPAEQRERDRGMGRRR